MSDLLESDVAEGSSLWGYGAECVNDLIAFDRMFEAKHGWVPTVKERAEAALWELGLVEGYARLMDCAIEAYTRSWRDATLFERWRNWLRGDRYWWRERVGDPKRIFEELVRNG